MRSCSLRGRVLSSVLQGPGRAVGKPQKSQREAARTPAPQGNIGECFFFPYCLS